MISTHPYNTWPLCVKLFADEAVKAWKEASPFPLPLAFTCTTELEGVDGKSGKVGSGRLGPINITDGDTIYSGFLWLVAQFYVQNNLFPLILPRILLSLHPVLD
jgi:hypothetical protein